MNITKYLLTKEISNVKKQTSENLGKPYGIVIILKTHFASEML
jgi:hypothetical protein